MEITQTISHCLPLSTLPPLAVTLQGCGQYLSTLRLMMHSVLHCSEHERSAHLRHLIHPGHSGLNIAVLVRLHGISFKMARRHCLTITSYCVAIPLQPIISSFSGSPLIPVFPPATLFSFPASWHVVVLAVTLRLSGVLHLHLHVACCLHLQAILPGLGNLSCGWLPWEQMFLMPLVEEKL